jgi:hypothetical protein
MTKTARGTLLLSLALLLMLTACGQQATEEPAATMAPQVTPTVQLSPTPTSPPAPTEAVPPAPTEAIQPAPTTAPPVPPQAETEDWSQFCQPSPEEEGLLVANLAMGSTVELDAYLYVKSFSNIRDNMMPFTLRGIPYQSGDSGWSDACQIHLLIPRGTGPNHVNELPDKFQFGDVVVWDTTGREIRGWQRNLDSYHVRVVGTVVKAYGGETGLDGSNTIRLEAIELLEG